MVVVAVVAMGDDNLGWCTIEVVLLILEVGENLVDGDGCRR